MQPHRYLPIGDADREEMLAEIGVGTIDDLFSSLPPAIFFDAPVAIDGPLSDQELRARFHGFEAANRVAGRDFASFLGGGAYRHDTPAVADHLIQRGEALTVYTPYQPEVSQGTLQAIFEFQTFMTLLTGLPVANASLYDGASAFAEAVLMAHRLQKKRNKVVISRAIHPQYRDCLRVAAANLEFEVVEVDWDAATGRTDTAALAAAVDANTACVAIQSPNYFGVIEPWSSASSAAKTHGALTVGVVAEALSLALLESPGAGGCDIACGEAQSFGLPLNFGGPYLGFLAARDEFKRAMPGRLVGETKDTDGKRAWVLTLSTREQHIRREKATSNICTNVALCALIATIYLALHGRVGLRKLAELNLQRAHSLARSLESRGFPRRFSGPFFNEFAVRSPRAVGETLKGFRDAGVLAGLALGDEEPTLSDCFLVAVTETNSPAQLEHFAEAAARMGS